MSKRLLELLIPRAKSLEILFVTVILGVALHKTFYVKGF